MRGEEGKPRLAIIVAVAANGVIGDGNRLPWRLPEDLRHFRAVTMGHPIIMGRKTWESIGRPLPGRLNIVVSRNPDFRAEGCVVAASLDDAVARAAPAPLAFVMGGAEVYRQAFPRCDRLHVTEIRREFAGDTRFPDFDRAAWREVSRESHAGADGLAYDFVVYERDRSV